MPYNIWCDGCNNHVAMGVRYNAEKSKIGMYYTTPIYKFRMKCHLCDNHYEIKTDPAVNNFVFSYMHEQTHGLWGSFILLSSVACQLVFVHLDIQNLQWFMAWWKISDNLIAVHEMLNKLFTDTKKNLIIYSLYWEFVVVQTLEQILKIVLYYHQDMTVSFIRLAWTRHMRKKLICCRDWKFLFIIIIRVLCWFLLCLGSSGAGWFSSHIVFHYCVSWLSSLSWYLAV